MDYCKCFWYKGWKDRSPTLKHQRLSFFGLLPDWCKSVTNGGGRQQWPSMYTITRYQVSKGWGNSLLWKPVKHSYCGWRWLLVDTSTCLLLAARAIDRQTFLVCCSNAVCRRCFPDIYCSGQCPRCPSTYGQPSPTPLLQQRHTSIVSIAQTILLPTRYIDRQRWQSIAANNVHR